MAQNLEKWISTELNKLLGGDSTAELTRYILSIGSAKDIEDYLNDLLDAENPQHQIFIQELCRRFTRDTSPQAQYQVYRKSETSVDPNQSNSMSGKGRNKKKDNNKTDGQKGKPNKQVLPSEAAPVKSKDTNPASKEKPVETENKKKTKYVPLFSAEGQARTVAKLPGRHVCDCLATKHGLINNCLQCGRVVCEQEGSGPCLFCDALVCTREDQDILAQGSRKSEKLRQKLLNIGGRTLSHHDVQKQDKGLEQALLHKDKLLEYDKTSVKRTQVIDDESDYFTTEGNTWLSTGQREKLKAREQELRDQRHGSRLDRKVTLDLAGRQVIEEDGSQASTYDVTDDVVQEVHYGRGVTPSGQETGQSDLLHPAVERLQFQNSQYSKAVKRTSGPADENRKERLQDSELKQLRDEGMCLSMHQPWATLLIKGVKRHEGRGWYTAHRGPLWIAAAGKQPSQMEIDQVEQQYILYYNDPSLQLPKDYPVSCLLGCVDLVDCVPQEQYKEQFPGGESESEYVFICENPQELVLKFPMKGQHKIYKLDSKLHQGAKKSLQSA